jgi:hypothetical protein
MTRLAILAAALVALATVVYAVTHARATREYPGTWD